MSDECLKPEGSLAEHGLKYRLLHAETDEGSRGIGAGEQRPVVTNVVFDTSDQLYCFVSGQVGDRPCRVTLPPPPMGVNQSELCIVSHDSGLTNQSSAPVGCYDDGRELTNKRKEDWASLRQQTREEEQ